MRINRVVNKLLMPTFISNIIFGAFNGRLASLVLIFGSFGFLQLKCTFFICM